MATAYDRFQSKMRNVQDAMMRIGDDLDQEDHVRSRGKYLEDQLSRVITNATRAQNYLSEMLVTGTVDTETEGGN